MSDQLIHSINPSEMRLVLSCLTQDVNQVTLLAMLSYAIFFPLGTMHFQDKQYSG